MSAPRRPAEPRPAEPRPADRRADGERAPAVRGSRPAAPRPSTAQRPSTAPRTGTTQRQPQARTAQRQPQARAVPPSRGASTGTPRPGATRPGGRTPSTPPRGTARAETVQQRTPRLFSVRTIVLGLVLVLAFILVYPTLHTYLRQEVDLRELRGEVADARQRNEDLQAELDRWDDPAYVTAQARERLSYVLPGETAYRVIDPETVEEDPVPADQQDTPVVETTTAVPWYTSVWDSVEDAGAAPTNEEAAAAAAQEKAAKEKAAKAKGAAKNTRSDDEPGAAPSP